MIKFYFYVSVYETCQFHCFSYLFFIKKLSKHENYRAFVGFQVKIAISPGATSIFSALLPTGVTVASFDTFPTVSSVFMENVIGSLKSRFTITKKYRSLF